MPQSQGNLSQKAIYDEIDRWFSVNLPYIPLSEVEKVVKTNFTGRFKTMLTETNLNRRGPEVWMSAWEHYYELMEEALVKMQTRINAAAPKEKDLIEDEIDDDVIDELLDAFAEDS